MEWIECLNIDFF